MTIYAIHICQFIEFDNDSWYIAASITTLIIISDSQSYRIWHFRFVKPLSLMSFKAMADVLLPAYAAKNFHAYIAFSSSMPLPIRNYSWR